MSFNFMSITVRLVLIIPLLIGVWLMVTPEPAYACSCMVENDLLKTADVVFQGTAVFSRLADDGRAKNVDWQNYFLVKNVWKGNMGLVGHVYSPGPGLECVYRPEAFTDYLVFGINFLGREDRPMTGNCLIFKTSEIEYWSGTGVSELDLDYVDLGRSHSPVLKTALVLLVIGLLIGLARWAWREKRPYSLDQAGK